MSINPFKWLSSKKDEPFYFFPEPTLVVSERKPRFIVGEKNARSAGFSLSQPETKKTSRELIEDEVRSIQKTVEEYVRKDLRMNVGLEVSEIIVGRPQFVESSLEDGILEVKFIAYSQEDKKTKMPIIYDAEQMDPSHQESTREHPHIIPASIRVISDGNMRVIELPLSFKKPIL